MRRRRTVVVFAASIAALVGCASDEPAADGVAFPDAPAPCAGPPRDPGEEHRQDVWRHIDGLVEDRDPDDRVELWLTFDRVRDDREAGRLVDGLTPTGVALAYEEQSGMTKKVVYAPGGDAETTVEALARDALERSLRPARRGTAPADPAVAGGEPPVSGVRASASAADLAAFVREHACDIYSAAPGDSSASPMLSPVIDSS